MRNIVGDRAVEWGFVQEHMPRGLGSCLDFGPGGSTLATRALEAGFEVTAVDLDATDWQEQPGVKFVHGDIFEAELPRFDLIINCSTVEHVGIPGRYGVTEDRPDGDLEAMALLRGLMRGSMLLTVPLGQDAVFAPMCRVYGEERLPLLLDGFDIEIERCHIKDGDNRWTACDRRTATNERASAGSSFVHENLYALGCFVLR